ncbi:MAG TPA: Asp-tRNA(Asn)/Glu-tRNA(Gln) amidotransferase subunit GatB, partial [Spirochaetota bacterium]|nr:Asp-tRNA(Asn)/Glu-tRNA(Gln) amidotransferase subunit GatB [Spirochaetota bacterium]
KNYMYPDLRKGYQISQYDKPICENGYIEVENNETKKKIRINRIHIEEDAGKLIHMEGNNTYIDYNRCGTPLLEIVSEPDITSSDEAVLYLTNLKEIFQYLEVSDCNMEEGSLRCDANISMMVKEGEKWVNTPIVEVKNMNSFKNVKKALEYEAIRLVEEYNKTKVTNNGKNKVTRGWDDNKEITVFQRTKEGESDYRYFPEPDLPHLEITDEIIEVQRKKLPELPKQKKARFIKEYNITDYDAESLVAQKDMGFYFESIAKLTKYHKKAANFILTDVMSILNQKEIGIKDFSLSKEHIAELIDLLGEEKISSWIGKQLFEKMLKTNKSPKEIMAEENLSQIDEGDLIKIIDGVLNDNPKSIEDYNNGKDNALKFLMGQVMKLSKGKANPVRATELILDKIKK